MSVVWLWGDKIGWGLEVVKQRTVLLTVIQKQDMRQDMKCLVSYHKGGQNIRWTSFFGGQNFQLETGGSFVCHLKNVHSSNLQALEG